MENMISLLFLVSQPWKTLLNITEAMEKKTKGLYEPNDNSISKNYTKTDSEPSRDPADAMDIEPSIQPSIEPSIQPSIEPSIEAANENVMDIEQSSQPSIDPSNDNTMDFQTTIPPTDTCKLRCYCSEPYLPAYCSGKTKYNCKQIICANCAYNEFITDKLQFSNK